MTAALLWWLLACGEPPIAPGMTEVDVAAFHEKKEAGQVPFLVDVRTPEEFASGHVPGAVNIPIDQVDARIGEFEPHKSDTIYLICQAGGRSGRVAADLAGRGYTTVNVTGGTGGWKAAGYPVE